MDQIAAISCIIGMIAGFPFFWKRSKKKRVEHLWEMRTNYYMEIWDDLYDCVWANLGEWMKFKNINPYRIEVNSKYAEFFFNGTSIRYVYAEHEFINGLWDGETPLEFYNIRLSFIDLSEEFSMVVRAYMQQQFNAVYTKVYRGSGNSFIVEL